MRSSARLAACLVPTAAALLYLSGGVGAFLQFAVFVLFFAFPACALLGRLPGLKCLEAGNRVPAAGILFVVLAVPAYYARRAVPLNAAWLDCGLAVALTIAAAWRGAYREWLRGLKESTAGVPALIPLLALPAVFALAWAGYAVPSHDKILFRGLYPIDFCNLSSMVALVKASPGPPLGHVTDTGALSYHWLFFAFAAWLSEFLDGRMPVGNALVLANYLAAGVFFAALAQLARRSSPPGARPWVVKAAVAIVMFAPMIHYGFVLAARLAGLDWLSWAGRNSLVLSILNSLVAFGNNTIAVAAVLTAVLLLDEWNRGGNPAVGLLMWVFAAILPGYSATLTLTVGAAFFAWFCLGKIRYPVRAACLAAPVGLIGYFVFKHANILGGPNGLSLQFDGGRWCVIFLLFAAPLCFFAAVGLRERPPWTLPNAIVAAGLLMPSILLPVGPVAHVSSMSMKTGTLLIVALLPWVTYGLNRVFGAGKSNRWLIGIGCALILLGLINSSVYLGQHVAGRLAGYDGGATALPADYCRALEYLRRNSARGAVVLDPFSTRFDHQALWPVALAERRVFLPGEWWYEQFLSTTAPSVSRRLRDFRAWQGSGFRDGELSRHHAALSDYLVLGGKLPGGGHWKLVKSFGDFSLYRSQIRPLSFRPAPGD